MLTPWTCSQSICECARIAFAPLMVKEATQVGSVRATDVQALAGAVYKRQGKTLTKVPPRKRTQGLTGGRAECYLLSQTDRCAFRIAGNVFVDGWPCLAVCLTCTGCSNTSSQQACCSVPSLQHRSVSRRAVKPLTKAKGDRLQVRIKLGPADVVKLTSLLLYYMHL